MSEPRARRYAQVDVFTTRRGYGNALAIVLDGDGLDDAEMQRFAAWTNLSETTFVLAPTSPAADFRMRIFTPQRELPFAGHPAVGTVHALLDAGDVRADGGLLRLECASGVLPVRVRSEGGTRHISVRVPMPELAPAHPAIAEALGRALGATPLADPAPRNVRCGPTWLIAEFRDASTVRALVPDFVALMAIAECCHAFGIAVFGRASEGDADIAVRAFCPGDSIPEDPVTGSANAAIGAYRHASGALAAPGARYRASQGREVGRNGFVDVDVDPVDGSVTIGGACITCVTGTLRFGTS